MKPNCVILAISSANQDIATSDAIKLAKKVDPTDEWTFRALTKLDLMAKGEDGYHAYNLVIKPKLKSHEEEIHLFFLKNCHLIFLLSVSLHNIKVFFLFFFLLFWIFIHSTSDSQAFPILRFDIFHIEKYFVVFYEVLK